MGGERKRGVEMQEEKILKEEGCVVQSVGQRQSRRGMMCRENEQEGEGRSHQTS